MKSLRSSRKGAPIKPTPIPDPGGIAQLQLLRLVSPALPVGAFHYSQGLESAVEMGWVHDAASAGDWIGGIAAHSLATLDLPMLVALHRCWVEGDVAGVDELTARLHAARESAELRAEDVAVGKALARLLCASGIEKARPWSSAPQVTYATSFSLAAEQHGIGARDCALGFAWSWCENQVLAAVKLVPLGQTAGQLLLEKLIGQIPCWVEQAFGLASKGEVHASSFLQLIASCRHETQYSRLFRS